MTDRTADLCMEVVRNSHFLRDQLREFGLTPLIGRNDALDQSDARLDRALRKIFEGTTRRDHGQIDIVRAAARGHRREGFLGRRVDQCPRAGRNGSAHPPSMKS